MRCIRHSFLPVCFGFALRRAGIVNGKKELMGLKGDKIASRALLENRALSLSIFFENQTTDNRNTVDIGRVCGRRREGGRRRRREKKRERRETVNI
jgi:hypothetical protein